MATTLDDAADVAIQGILAGYNLVPLSNLYNPRVCPARFLPFLAHYFEARTWTALLGEDYQRTALEHAWIYHRYHGRQFALDQFTRDSGVEFNIETTVDANGRLDEVCAVITSSHSPAVVAWAENVIGRLLAFPFVGNVCVRAVPDAPAAPTLMVSGTTITATWDAPDDNNAPITAYAVQYKLSDASTWTDVPSNQVDTGQRRATISGLQNRRQYDVRVNATNNVGTSGWGAAGRVGVGLALPGAPRLVLGVVGTTVILSLDDPADTGGLPLLERSIERRVENMGEYGAITGTQFTGTPGTTYQLRARVRNELGWGPYSPVRTASIAALVPDAPTVTLSVTGQTGAVAWTLPANNGAAITSYDVEQQQDGGEWTAVSHTTLLREVMLFSLVRGSTYRVRVRARNSAGAGAYGQSNAVLVLNVPGAVGAPAVTAQSSSALAVTWVAPGDGGSAITDYDVRYRRTGATTWIERSHSGTGRATNITSLQASTAYEVQVRASNAVGAGEWSTSGTATTRAQTVTPTPDPEPDPEPTITVPSAPGSASLRYDGGGRFTVSWSAPSSDGGSPILAYAYTITGPNGATTGGRTNPAFSSSSRTLNDGSGVYTVTVWAANAQGQGPGTSASVTR